MSLIIVEVLQRSIQGRTRPYICRADDGEVYFVKGRSATRNGLVAEWLCAELATALGIPVAPYAIATVPDELMDADLSGWLAELGPGEVFASRKVDAVELTRTHRDLADIQVRQDLVVFDWWVRNGDRTLTDRGGNPNLLWKHEGDGSLVVIDHNLAFDKDFSAREFFDSHVFADVIRPLFSDFFARESYAKRLRTALDDGWEKACAMLPGRWSFVDPEMTVPAHFPLQETLAALRRCEREDFWGDAP